MHHDDNAQIHLIELAWKTSSFPVISHPLYDLSIPMRDVPPATHPRTFAPRIGINPVRNLSPRPFSHVNDSKQFLGRRRSRCRSTCRSRPAAASTLPETRSSSVQAEDRPCRKCKKSTPLSISGSTTRSSTGAHILTALMHIARRSALL